MSKQCFECNEAYSWDSGRFSKSQWLKGTGRCKTCVQATGSVGGHTGDGCGGVVTRRTDTTERYADTAGEEGANAVVYKDRLFSRGAFKNVYKGLYTSGSRRGEECVFKKFQQNLHFRPDWFDKEVAGAQRAAGLIDRFNREGTAPRRVKVRINIPSVRTTTSPETTWLVEPFIHNWTKFNSNTGFCKRNAGEVDEVMQALSHFSYHASSGQFVLSDLQGGVYRDGVILSDPIVLSREAERYGGGDLGPKGISTFFSRHHCNRFCLDSWQLPRDTNAYFAQSEGSSLLGNYGIPHKRYLYQLMPLDTLQEEDSYDSDYY
mmetsp:Transcript_28172/g.71311  ORF Transcript_28172/g.71311 Transcript_28172/m.71311 type:complete len:319 (-) Transcript_28172:321-1277(-)|eukprot:CAMPEP_0174916406 /NCGR_PEP_ID=MMETSP1355-20121228/1804_1 /TAXON_ID=464990 /ORGANISM="Hemiselmis tepida, Strain CCMP443" /LENGTH=318 /DNA_ID=CAMNT_0016161413 /DNA_START=62 /DNA_END=1018 /DNA_ORIENTATION=+